MTCPRCDERIDGDLYGPCASCREKLNTGAALAVALVKLGRLKFVRFWSD